MIAVSAAIILILQAGQRLAALQTERFRIKFMTYGSDDLLKTNLKLSASANAICGEPPKVDPQTLSVTLAVAPPDATKGEVTVSGFAAAGEERYVYLSGTPGTLPS